MGIIQGIIIRAKVLAGTLRVFSIIDTIRYQRTFHFGWWNSLSIQWGASMWAVQVVEYDLPDGWKFWGRNPVKGGA